MPPWEVLPHPSDLRVRVRGRDRRELFADAALSVFALSARPSAGWPARLEEREVAVQADDEPGLLRRLLAECVFLFESVGFLARAVTVESLDPRACRVRLTGACFAPERVAIDHVIKAVTWHGLVIRDEVEGMSAEILHDL